MAHKFKLKQMVRLSRPGFADKLAGAAASYEIIRLMPANQGGEYSYRIKATGSGERAVLESELVAVGYSDKVFS